MKLEFFQQVSRDIIIIPLSEARNYFFEIQVRKV